MSQAPTAYIPPHMRNRQPASPSAGPSRHSSQEGYDRQAAGPSRQAAPGSRWTSRQQSSSVNDMMSSGSTGSSSRSIQPGQSRWSRESTAGPSRDTLDHGRHSLPARPTPYDESTSRTRSPARNGATYHSAPARAGPGGREGMAGSPSLHVYGDSFVGPMKLISDQYIRVQTYKGASAKVSRLRSNAWSANTDDIQGSEQSEID